MSEILDFLDYASRIVRRYRASGLTRGDFADDCGIPITTLDYYIRRTNRDAGSREAERLPNCILPVDLAVEEPKREAPFAAAPGGVAVRLGNGRVIEVARGFDRGLQCEVRARRGFARGAGADVRAGSGDGDGVWKNRGSSWFEELPHRIGTAWVCGASAGKFSTKIGIESPDGELRNSFWTIVLTSTRSSQFSFDC